MPRIKLWVDTGFPTARYDGEVKIDDAEWNLLNDEQKEDRLAEEAEIFMNERISCGASVVD